MKELQITARCTIHDGHLEEFKTLAEETLARVKEKGSGVLQYDWFLDEDETRCVVRGAFESSEALLEHMKNVKETVDRLLKICDLSTEIFGDPSPELMKAVDGLGVVIYDYFQGLRESGR